MSFLIVITLLVGIGVGAMVDAQWSGVVSSLSPIMLMLLIFSVGIDMGVHKEVFIQVKKLGFKILLIPTGVAVGSLLGGGILSLFIEEPLKECLAISSGMGWYSLSGIMITEAGNPTGGAISFLSNVLREMLTFVVVPFLAKYLNFYCAIAPAGATAMDTTLAIIARNTNGKIAVVAFVSGISLTMIIPVLLPFFL